MKLICTKVAQFVSDMDGEEREIGIVKVKLEAEDVPRTEIESYKWDSKEIINYVEVKSEYLIPNAVDSDEVIDKAVNNEGEFNDERGYEGSKTFHNQSSTADCILVKEEMKTEDFHKNEDRLSKDLTSRNSGIGSNSSLNKDQISSVNQNKACSYRGVSSRASSVEMTNFDTDCFISEIEARPTLWNSRSAEYSNKIDRGKSWEELCEIFIPDFSERDSSGKNQGVVELQRKWKSLRDSYTRELGKMKKTKGGSSTDGRKQYVCYQQLSFLSPVCETRPARTEDDSDSNVAVTQDGRSLRKASPIPSRKKKRKNFKADSDKSSCSGKGISPFLEQMRTEKSHGLIDSQSLSDEESVSRCTDRMTDNKQENTTKHGTDNYACNLTKTVSKRTYKCVDCVESFEEESSLFKHFQETHCIQFKCPECNYSCRWNSRLQKHVQAVHRKLKLFNCEECDYSCCRKDQLSEHTKAVHIKLKRYKCVECDYTCRHKCHLSQHITAVHLGLKLNPYKCEECDFSCRSKFYLTQHITAVHRKLKPFLCIECEYSSSSKIQLSKHVNAVHKKLRQFLCTECDYACSWRSQLSDHINVVHKKLKPFSCSECDRSFSRKCSLSKHIEAVHRKVKPFVCLECDYCCSAKITLSKHIASVHSQ